MADFAIRWNDFTGGDAGTLDVTKWASNQFNGSNVVIYDSGLAGVRAGFKRWAVTGLPNATVVEGPVGFDVSGNELVVVVDNVYRVGMFDQPAFAVAMGAYPAPARTPVQFVHAKGALYSLVSGTLYKHGAAVTTPITTPYPLSMVVRWGLFLVGVDRDMPWRLWFSLVDASGPNPDVWPINNFIDIGFNIPITSLAAIFNTLYVGKRSGWWAVSGVLGTLASVREVLAGNGPVDRRTTAVTTDNRIVYWPVEKVPTWFNGERVRREVPQRMEPRNLPFPCDTVIVTPTSQRLLLAGDDGGDVNTSVWDHGTGWTHHQLPFRLAGLAPADVKSGYDMPEHVTFAIERTRVIGDPVHVLAYHHSLNRPGHTGDFYASPDDNASGQPVTGSVLLPAWFDGQGRQVRVRSLIVQFRKWDGGMGPGVMNRLAATVDALGAYGRGLEPGVVHQWAEPMPRSSTDGTDDSVRWNLGDQGWANGFQVRIDAMVGVALREVVAICDVRSDRV